MQPNIRISDFERDRACAILREHHALGRLGIHELPTRLAAAQTAVTWGDLQALFGDMPPIPGMPLAPMQYAPPMPPIVQQPYFPPPLIAPVVVQDPAAGYKTAALIFFLLGFVTFGLAWIPAIIFAIMASNARSRATPVNYPGPRGDGSFG
ncbi:DUF1707 and DUF4870 domain-containing protein [Sphaerisporangium corydalis]|uniref:DUF1707 and DUF4870 domain-containing protein n=1 Tax=Sphaerisporangium corydalis TaxID=1441875 RepID=A0ABV9ETJ7_9ACTN|nr:DUF1707 and DUF4870 domain-containing protein [Sphaerisporangium corydalis]